MSIKPTPEQIRNGVLELFRHEHPYDQIEAVLNRYIEMTAPDQPVGVTNGNPIPWAILQSGVYKWDSEIPKLERLPERESIAHEWKATPEVLTTPIKCLLCDDEAVVIVHAPQGCICSPNKYQPRCMQHLMRASDTDEEISVVEDFRIPLSKIEDQGGV